MHLEIRWIEDLIAIEQTGSLSRAASLRCLSQSAFSRRLQQLEQQLGFLILERHAKDLKFTEAGLVLLNSAKTMAKQLNDTIALLNNMQKENNLSIRFAVAHSLTSQFFRTFYNFSQVISATLKFKCKRLTCLKVCNALNKVNVILCCAMPITAYCKLSAKAFSNLFN